MGKLRDLKNDNDDDGYMGKPSLGIYSDKHLKDAGFDKLPSVGDVLSISGKVKVVAVSMSEWYKNKGSKSVTLEFESLDVDKKKSSEEIAKKLYGDS